MLLRLIGPTHPCPDYGSFKLEVFPKEVLVCIERPNLKRIQRISQLALEILPRWKNRNET